MSIHNRALFPEDMSWGTRVGPGFRNLLARSDSGHVARRNRWPAGQARLNLDVAKAIRSPEQMAAMLSFYRCRRGSAHGFKIRDWTDWSTRRPANEIPDGTTGDSVVIAVGDGSKVLFTCRKYYGSGAKIQTRLIRKLIPPGAPDHHFKLWVGASEKTLGTDYTVDWETGDIRMVVAPGVEIIRASFTHYSPARFGPDVDRRYEVGIGEDEEGIEYLTAGTIDVHELTEHEWCEEEWTGGAATDSKKIDVSAQSPPTQLNLKDGFLQEIVGFTTGWDFELPAHTSLIAGGPYLLIWNNESTASLDIVEPGVGTVASVIAGNTAEMWLSDTADGSGFFWRVR